MSTTKLKKKVFQPTQVDKLVIQVGDLGEDVMALDEAIEAIRHDFDRLERLVGILQHTVNNPPTYTYSYTTSTSEAPVARKPWWKRWLGR